MGWTGYMTNGYPVLILGWIPDIQQKLNIGYRLYDYLSGPTYFFPRIFRNKHFCWFSESNDMNPENNKLNLVQPLVSMVIKI